MSVIGWIQILLYCAIVIALVPWLGGYMTRVFNGERTLLSPLLRPVEAMLYAVGGVDERREQHWVTYTVAMLFFHVAGFLILYALLRFWEASSSTAETLALHDVARQPGSPGRLFKIDESSLVERLEGVEKLTEGRLSYGETAGLRQLYRRKRIDPNEVLADAYAMGARPR